MRYLILLSFSLLSACLNTPEPLRFPQHEVRIAGRAGDLAGELVLPNGTGSFPAVILIAGSGAQNRDETVAGHRIFRVMAENLAQAGIASLRYDKRGVGESAGHFESAMISDFAADAGRRLIGLRHSQKSTRARSRSWAIPRAGLSHRWRRAGAMWQHLC